VSIYGNIRMAWDSTTSSDPEGWTEANPAHGQCAVTALVIQDMCGGELLRGKVGAVSHYWNLLPDGSEVDITYVQFPPGSPLIVGRETRSREYVLSFPDTLRRYERMRERVFQ